MSRWLKRERRWTPSKAALSPQARRYLLILLGTKRIVHSDNMLRDIHEAIAAMPVTRRM